MPHDNKWGQQLEKRASFWYPEQVKCTSPDFSKQVASVPKKKTTTFNCIDKTKIIESFNVGILWKCISTDQSYKWWGWSTAPAGGW